MALRNRPPPAGCGRPREARTRALAAAPLVLVAIAVACGGTKRADCDALMGLVNESIAELENRRQQLRNDTKRSETRALADHMQATGEKASQLAVTTPEVKALAQRWAAMSRDIATHARSAADAADAKDLVKRSEAEAKLNQSLELEDPILDELNTFCSR